MNYIVCPHHLAPCIRTQPLAPHLLLMRGAQRAPQSTRN